MTDFQRSDLLAVIDQQERRSHIYGRSDCLLNAAEVAAVITGRDYAATFRGRYKTLRGAYRVLRWKGFTDPMAYVRSLGFAEIHHSEATDGDVGAVMQDGHWTFGNIIGAHLYVTAAEGKAILPRSRSQVTFRLKES